MSDPVDQAKLAWRDDEIADLSAALREIAMLPDDQVYVRTRGIAERALKWSVASGVSTLGFVEKPIVTEEQIKHMVSRFLGWRLPSNFSPDAGISYIRPNYPPSWAPSGTNLLTATQAEEMVRYIIDGMLDAR